MSSFTQTHDFPKLDDFFLVLQNRIICPPPHNESLWSPKQLPAFFKIYYSMFNRRNNVIKVWKFNTAAIDYRIYLFGTMYLIHLILNYKVIVLQSGVTANFFYFILFNNKNLGLTWSLQEAQNHFVFITFLQLCFFIWEK